ncbi:MAG: ABC transporter permease, partial [Clostridiales Family XIII bacterium]|jgi:putative ABC transport system permease protein|nr:ABC transporter permease [Clostridiales Family XIII bacterium]
VEELGLPLGDYTGENAKFISVAKMSTGGNGEKYGSFNIIKGKSSPLKIASFDDFTEESGYEQAKWEDIDVTFADHLPKTITKGRVQNVALVVPYSLKSQFEFLNAEQYGSDVPDLTFLSSDPMKSAAEMDRIIKETTGLTEGSGYYLTNMAEELEQNRSIILVVNVFTYGFVVLISLIAIANVFNTVSTGINLRRREFAMLRSVGMTDRGFNRMMNCECVFYGLKSLLFALPVAVGVTYLIYRAMMNGVDIAFSLPWASIGISVLSVFLVVFVTMLYAVGKVKKANVIDALRDELA